MGTLKESGNLLSQRAPAVLVLWACQERYPYILQKPSVTISKNVYEKLVQM